jgi:hypothetical protein
MPLERDTVIRLLLERAATRPCHRCGQDKFSVIDKYSSLSLQDEITGPLRLGGLSVPVVLVACDNCGAITAHAVGALGLLPKPKEGKDGNK